MSQYQVDLSPTNLFTPMIQLEVLYESMPKTGGCEKCEEINGNKSFWCCKYQCCSMFYCEFIYVWKYIEKHWSKTKRLDLVISAIRNYFRNDTNKGCIFFKNECLCYNLRPLSCRLYGIMPKESWREREKRINNILGDNVKIEPQCTLVKTVDGSEVTVEMENQWFFRTMDIESKLGVSSNIIKLHDNPGGSYRTFHDHLLMELFSAQFLGMLTKVKLSNPSEKDINTTLEILIKTVQGQDTI